mgnify:CR=1 FL=1
MKISKLQLRKIIKEEKVKLQEIRGETFQHGIFNGNYIYDLLVDDVEDYLRTSGGGTATGLTRVETDKIREAIEFALSSIIEDYS